MADKGYVGKIANQGAQEVKAPHQAAPKKGRKSIIRGADLRAGKGGK